MTRSTWAALAVALAALPLASSCNDGIQCQTAALVLITSPTSDVVADAAPGVDGVQTDVHVRTTLAQGEALTLTITDASGTALGTATTTAAADGTAVFPMVTLPSGQVTLTARAMDACGDDSNSVTISVVAGTGCTIAISPAPVDNTFYAPLKVLNAAADPDPATPGFQATLTITTAPKWTADLYVTGPGAPETPLGTVTADLGTATQAVTLADGHSSVRAVCHDPVTGTSAPSLTASVLVDTTPPTCAMAQPAPGSTITPAYDADHDLSNGVQLTLGGAIGGTDVMGEAATFTIIAPDGSHMDLAGGAIDGAGATSAAATFAPVATPATYGVELRASDHAGNPCTAPHEDYKVVYGGCDIQVTSPTGPVTADVDGNPANGAQLDANVTVATACAGQTVTTDCGVGTTTATVPASGALTMRLTACTTDPCELTEACTFAVTSTDGIQTSAGLDLVFDDQAPAVSLAIVNPSLACGAKVGPEVDIDPAVDGVQVSARVTSPAAAVRQLRVTSSAGTSTLDATSDVEVTLTPGVDTLFGVAADALGNTATTPGCGLTLSDLTVSFLPPAADGMLSARDGTVSGSSLTTSICGAVNKPGAAVTLAVDGGAAQAATVTGTQWCRQVTLAVSPPSHTLVASAVAGSSFGSATLVVAVDLTPPGPVGDLAATAVTRRRLHATWTAPSDAGAAVSAYEVKLATTTLTDGNFDTTGVVVPTGAPAAPGTPEQLDVAVRAGGAYWLGIASVDAAGNRAVADIVGPLTPVFDQTGAITPPDAATAGNVGLGWSIAHGKFNDDDYADVAVGAPGRSNGAISGAGAVYVYFGGPTGIAATPSVILQGTEGNAQVGSGVTAVRWSSATRDDLAIGAPFSQGRGRIFVFHGGATFPTTGAVNVTTAADQIIGINATSPGWFAGSWLGFDLATSDFDGDGTPDLIASAIYGGGTKGGVVAIFGGTAGAAAIGLSDVDASQLAGAEAQIMENPTGATGKLFGRFLYDLGRTTGAADPNDDLFIGQTDDSGTTTDSAWIYRGAAARTPGVSFRSFTPGTDVRVDYVTTDKTTMFGAAATSVPDLDGDGSRDVAIGAWQFGANDGQVVIVSGSTVGTAGVARTGDPGVVLATINGVGNQRLGAAIATRAGTSGDVDGDGKDDLLIAGLVGGVAHLYTFYGGGIPSATITTAAASYVVTGPSTFLLSQAGVTPAAAIAWVGDVNGDGLDDVCWGDSFDNNKDGSFEVLWDNGM